MLKLIKPLPDSQYLYWEFWEDDDEFTVHEGILGDEGETMELDATKRKNREKIEELIAAKKQDGFSEIDPEKMASITVQYVIEGFGTEADLDKRNEVIDALDDILGWTGNGSWSAADVGANTMNVNCLVIDIEAAVKTIVECLEENDWLEGAVIAHETEEESRVIFPEGAKFYQ